MGSSLTKYGWKTGFVARRTGAYGTPIIPGNPNVYTRLPLLWGAGKQAGEYNKPGSWRLQLRRVGAENVKIGPAQAGTPTIIAVPLVRVQEKSPTRRGQVKFSGSVYRGFRTVLAEKWTTPRTRSSRGSGWLFVDSIFAEN